MRCLQLTFWAVTVRSKGGERAGQPSCWQPQGTDDEVPLRPGGRPHGCVPVQQLQQQGVAHRALLRAVRQMQRHIQSPLLQTSKTLQSADQTHVHSTDLH